MTETAPQTPEETKVRRRIVRRPKTGLGWFMLCLTLLVLLVAATGLVTRYGVLTPQGLLLIEARTDGLKLGRVGKLKIEGLGGDIWSDFTVRRLTISDEKGIWLEASDIAVDWRSGELFSRRFHAQSVSAGLVRVLRRPTLTPKTVDRDLPVSFDIDSLKLRLETLPAFSVRRGYFDITGDIDIARRGPASARLSAASLSHAGDGMRLVFDAGKGKAINLAADAVETQGGAIAGALGLAADKPFSLVARVSGAAGEGRFTLSTRSGDLVPASGEGAWGRAGGSGRARILLSASSLIRAQESRFGPVVDISLGSRPAGGLQDIDLTLKAENLTLRARGPVDVAKRRIPRGMGLDVSVPDLNRLARYPRMGPGRFVGRLTGTPSDWKAVGAVSIDRLALGGYTLARARGTGEVGRRRRELNIKAKMDGAGGGGTGLFAAWMGPAPTASVSLSRLTDGSFLIRSIDGKGAGMDLKGTGSRGILGGLAFKGDIRLSNLAAARRGASGTLSGAWSASRARKGQPWMFTADGRGRDFASGLAELDRLLGPDPRVRGRASYLAGEWSVAEANVDGAKADISGAGTIVRGGDMRLALDWRADGPFRAGPVEVAGKVLGKGALSGTLAAPRADLEADIEAIDLPRVTVTPAHLRLSFARQDGRTVGTARLTGTTPQGAAYANAGFSFAPGGLDLTGIDARGAGLTAAGSLSLRDRSPSRADLTLTAGPGAFVAAGQANGRVRIVDGPGGPSGSVRIEASGLRLAGSEVVVRSGVLAGDGPLSRLPYTVTADLVHPRAPLRLEGGGVASEDGQAWNVSFEGLGRIRRTEIRTLAPLRIAFGGPETSARGAFSVGGGRADLEARQGDGRVSISARVEAMDLNVFSEDLAGKVTGSLLAQGRGDDLSGSLDARLAGARSRDGPQALAIDGAVRGTLAGARLSLDANLTSAQGLRSTASVVLPAEASAAPFRLAINRTRPMSGRFDVDGELQPVWDLFFGGARSLGGRLIAQGTVAGTFNDPQLSGRASLTSGRFEDAATGLKLSNVSFNADLDEEVVAFRQFTGADGRGGTLAGEGRLSLTRGGASTFTLNATRFLMIDNDQAEVQASGAVTVTRDAEGRPKIAGALTIDRADIVADPPTPSGVVTMEVVERNRPAGRPDAFEGPVNRGPAVALDVTLRAPRRVFVRGRGLDVELSLDAHVGGSSRQPDLTGVARVVRGDYQFAAKRFEFDDDGAVYLAASPERIRLELSASREDPTLTAVVRIRGTAAKPEITLTSTPVLPNDEVLAQVLFGRSASQLSPLETAQLANALTALATGGGFDVIGGLQNLTRLDRLAFAGGDASGVAVSGGKYLTDDVYLEITGGGREGPSAQVEWRVRRNLSIVSRLRGDGDTRLSVRWRRDYGRATAAK